MSLDELRGICKEDVGLPTSSNRSLIYNILSQHYLFDQCMISVSNHRLTVKNDTAVWGGKSPVIATATATYSFRACCVDCYLSNCQNRTSSVEWESFKKALFVIAMAIMHLLVFSNSKWHEQCCCCCCCCCCCQVFKNGNLEIRSLDIWLIFINHDYLHSASRCCLQSTAFVKYFLISHLLFNSN